MAECCALMESGFGYKVEYWDNEADYPGWETSWIGEYPNLEREAFFKTEDEAKACIMAKRNETYQYALQQHNKYVNEYVPRQEAENSLHAKRKQALIDAGLWDESKQILIHYSVTPMHLWGYKNPPRLIEDNFYGEERDGEPRDYRIVPCWYFEPYDDYFDNEKWYNQAVERQRDSTRSGLDL
jgi:hypothetical protein